jgi:hypothetical protein
MSDFLDHKDTDIGKLWDVLLQILGNDGRIPQDLPLDLHDGPKVYFEGLLDRPLFLASWHRTKCF